MCYRPCAVDVGRFYILNIFHVMSGKRMVVSIAFPRKRTPPIMCRQYVVQFYLETTRLLIVIDFLLAVERTQQAMDAMDGYFIAKTVVKSLRISDQYIAWEKIIMQSDSTNHVVH